MTVLIVHEEEKRKIARCDECGTTLSYEAEDVVRSSGAQYMTKVGGMLSGSRVIARSRRFVVCPRETCKSRVEVK